MKASNVFNITGTGFFGIDLGTTNSVVATFKADSQVPEVLNSKSGSITPSVVAILPDHGVIVGKEARDLRGKMTTYSSFKKYMGTTHTFEGGHTAKDISKIFIEKLMSEIFELNPEYEKTKDVVLSVPAYFDTPQIQDTASVFIELGFNILFIQQEPISAALVYQTLKKIDSTISVFDLGGGTFDTILIESMTGFPKDSVDFYRQLGLSLPSIEDTLSITDISGDNLLGGDNIDEEVHRIICAEHKIRPPKEEIINVIEDVKILKQSRSFEWKGKSYTITNEHIIAATDVIWKRAESIMNARFKAKKVVNPHIVLCGGSTKSKYIREKLQENYAVSFEIDPDLSVAIGNAMTARNIIENQGLPFLSVMPKHIGVKLGGRMKPVIKKGQVFPCVGRTSARSKEQYVTKMDINFYQSEDLFSTPTLISTVTIDNIESWDKEGYANIQVTVRVLADQTLKVEVFHEETSQALESEISFIANDISSKEGKGGSKAYNRFKEKYNNLGQKDKQIEQLLQEFLESDDDKALASKIAVALAKKAGK
jgi:molecular chaperone DnaK (HSP70)